MANLIEQAFDEGQKAFAEGLTGVSCPYSINKDRRDAWLEGWRNAKMKVDPTRMPPLPPNDPITIAEVSGGLNNYYLSRVDHPQREEQPPYTAECEDLIESLELRPDEANIFKEIWRSANARKGNGKPGHRALYGAEKIVHYARRNHRWIRRMFSSNNGEQNK